MNIYVEKDKKQIELPACTAKDLLTQLEINPDTVLVVRNDDVVLPEEELAEDDEIKILSVVSGG